MNRGVIEDKNRWRSVVLKGIKTRVFGPNVLFQESLHLEEELNESCLSVSSESKLDHDHSLVSHCWNGVRLLWHFEIKDRYRVLRFNPGVRSNSSAVEGDFVNPDPVDSFRAPVGEDGFEPFSVLLNTLSVWVEIGDWSLPIAVVEVVFEDALNRSSTHLGGVFDHFVNVLLDPIRGSGLSL